MTRLESENAALMARVHDLAAQVARLSTAEASRHQRHDATAEALRDASVVEAALRSDLATQHARVEALEERLRAATQSQRGEEDKAMRAASVLRAERRQMQLVAERLQQELQVGVGVVGLGVHGWVGGLVG